MAIPEPLKALLSFSNGGHPELDTLAGSEIFTVDTFYHLGSGEDTESLQYAISAWQPVLGSRALPFAKDGGGNQFFLDLSSNPPPVRFCLHDEGFRILDVAPSLEEFLSRLSLDPDMI
jgi:hypothetical protein